VSGGHFNPAVTAWALASGKIGKSKALQYIIAQVGAALSIWILSSMVKY
ncbi:MAG: aquaporin, partial [bacterium]